MVHHEIAAEDRNAKGMSREGLLPSFTMDRLSPDLELVALRELGETPQLRRELVAQLRTLIAGEPALKCPLDEEFLVRFLRSRKYRLEETLQIIRKYFRIRLECPDIFDNLLPSRILFDVTFRRHKLVTLLKDPDPLGRRIVVFKLGVWNPSVCPLNEFFRIVIVGAEYCLLEQRFQVAGVVAVVDMEGLNVSHLLHYTPSELRKTVKLGQECYPLRIKNIFIVNNPPVFHLMYTVVKLFLKQKLIKRIHFIERDYDKLHKLIPRERLPEEYGGSLENYDYDEFETSLRSTEDYFVELGKCGYRKQRT